MTPVAEFGNRHKGKRCFLLGNGPSLNLTDLRRLKGKFSIGQNRIYLRFEPTYWCGINALWLQNPLVKAEITGPRCLSRETQKFMGHHQYEDMNERADFTFVRRAGSMKFSTDLAVGFCGGNTVTFFSLQLAYYMGFKQVILVGVDHHWIRTGAPHSRVISDGADPDHFRPDYFPKGMEYQSPDLAGSDRAYRIAKEAFDADGREIVDATIGGHLTVFEKVDYDAVT